MPRVLPFTGLRYAAPPQALAALVSPPYDVISPAEQAQLRALSPHNASYVELPIDVDGQPRSRYRDAADRLAAWRRDGVLKADPSPAYYLAETQFSHAGRTLSRRDLLAALSVEPWSSGAVLPHEHTLAGPKVDRLELLRATHLNPSPIWVLHRNRLPALDQAWRAAESLPPTLEFTWHAERHRVWLVDAASTVAAIGDSFGRGGPLYVADGHHRYETSLAFRAEADSTVPGAGATLAALTWAQDPGLLALATHRLLRHLDPALSLEEAGTRWAELFQSQSYPVSQAAPPEQVDALMQHLASSGGAAPSFGLYGLGNLDVFVVLQVRGGKVPDGVLPAERSEAWKSLDVSLLHALLVDPLVQQAGRPRADVLSYTRDPHAAVAAVREGRASAAFFLNPTPVSGVLRVADTADRMPEKSTYFHPKPPAGLVMRDLDAPV